MLEELKNRAKEMKKIIENKEELKTKAKDVWNKSNEIFNETSNIIKEKTDQAITMYQEYQDRERETIPQNLATKIDREIKEKYSNNCLKGDLIPGKVTIFETKVGGFPYLPKDMMFPKDKNGVDMRLLVQIKCDDLEYLEGFPNKGILQIFTSKSFNFGSNPENPFDNSNFKIIYHPTIDKTIRLDDLYKKTLLNELEEYPIRMECPLYFTRTVDTISITDYHYLKEFKNILGTYNNYKDFTLEEITPLISSDESIFNKVGGNPNFINPDNRKEENNLDTLLFQLHNDNNIVNVGKNILIKFYINSNDLKQLNFDNVFYHIEYM